MSRNFLEAVAHRRSYYHLSDRALVSDSLVMGVVDELLTTMPSPFNVQSARVVVLLGAEHRDLWQIVIDTLRNIVAAEHFERSKHKIETSFLSGHGTLLFYEDEDALNRMRSSYPTYAENVGIWSEQSSGMLQFALWTALEDFGYGASLQHYNPLIDRAVSERWGINSDWLLKAQMPFGAPIDTPSPRNSANPPHNRRLTFVTEV